MNEIFSEVNDFFTSHIMEPRWKDTLLILIPKCSPASEPSHYRPISLCTSIYRICAKIITNRMKPILSGIISPEQATFVPGRLLSDNCILAQEIMHQLHKTESKDGFMAIKIGMEKAFDRIQWSFVRRALVAFNFPPAWISLVLECITKPRIGCSSMEKEQNG